jgi:hypothetical protein
MKRRSVLPAGLGQVLALPLEDGRYGVAYVVAVDGRHSGVVLSAWVGPKPATLADVELRPYLREPSVYLGRLDGPLRVATRWVSTPLPPGYVVLGTKEPTASDRKLEIDSYAGGWSNVTGSILLDWLEKNDPAGAKKLVEGWRRKRAKEDRARAKAEAARVATLTLADLAKGTPLPSWTKRHPPKVVIAARAILRKLARDIAARSDAAGRRELLKDAVLRIGALEKKDGFQILTTEREDLVEAFVDVTRAAKMRGPADPTERWRDW